MQIPHLTFFHGVTFVFWFIQTFYSRARGCVVITILTLATELKKMFFNFHVQSMTTKTIKQALS